MLVSLGQTPTLRPPPDPSAPPMLAADLPVWASLMTAPDYTLLRSPVPLVEPQATELFSGRALGFILGGLALFVLLRGGRR